MIWPRILHRVWLDEPERPEFEAWRDRLGELHPDWEIRTYRDSSELTWLGHADLFAELLETDPYGRAPDLLRYELLWRDGGIYIDTDFEPLRPFDELLTDERPFAAWESERTMCTALLAAPPQHPAIGVLLDGVPDRLEATKGRPANEAIGPEYATALWRERADVRRLPPWTFYPVGWWEKHRLGRTAYHPETFAVHHWAAGWKENDPKPHLSGQVGAKVSVLVAFRDVDGSRTRLWDVIQARFAADLPEVELVVASDDGEMPFHKTLAINRAAQQASGDIFAVWDADSWCDPTCTRQAIDYVAQNPLRWARPWARKVKMNAAATEHVLTLGAEWTGSIDHRRFGRPEHTNTYWAAPPLVLSREAFELVGGMDERFRGWGQEDTAFALALSKLVGNPKVFRGICWHLWHPRIGRTGDDLWEGQDSSRANQLLLREYRTARTPEQMRAVVRTKESV